MSSIQDFVPLQKLGEGTYSTVYKVRRKSDQKVYALKKVRMKNLTQKQKENALNEIRILASLQCPTIVGYKQAFFDEKLNLLCIVMQYASGGDLHNCIAQAKKDYRKIPQKVIWKMIADILEALAHLHKKGILHRDLKSANIFINRNQSASHQATNLYSNCRYKLGDLNVSKVNYGGQAYTQTGTPYYASPQVWRDQPYDSKSDLYSFGCIVYEMACMRPPFQGKDMEELFKSVQKNDYRPIPEEYSYELADIIDLCLHKDAKKRPSAEKLLQHPVVVQFLKKSKAGNQNQFISPENRMQGQNAQNKNKQSNILLKTIKLPTDMKSLQQNLPQSKYDDEIQRKAKPKQQKRSVQRINSVPNHEQIAVNYRSDRPDYKDYKQNIIKSLQNNAHNRKDNQSMRKNQSQVFQNNPIHKPINLSSPKKKQKPQDTYKKLEQNFRKNRSVVSPCINLMPNNSNTNIPKKSAVTNRINQSQVFLSPRASNNKNLYRSPQDYVNKKIGSAHINMSAQNKIAQLYSDRKNVNYGYGIHLGGSEKKVSHLADRYQKFIKQQLSKKQISIPRTQKRKICSQNINMSGPTTDHSNNQDQNYQQKTPILRNGPDRKVIEDWKKKLVKKSRVFSGNGHPKHNYCY